MPTTVAPLAPEPSEPSGDPAPAPPILTAAPDDRRIHVVQITQAERLVLARTVDGWLDEVLGRDQLAPGSPAFFDAAEVAEGALPARARTALALLRRGAVEAVVLRGLPVDPMPGPTPTAPGEAPTGPRVGYAWVAMAVRRLGHELGYALEKGGSLVHHVYPVEALAASQSNGSSRVELGLHTENAFHPIRPDHIVLYGVRAPHPPPATRLAFVDDVLRHLSDDEIEVLRQPRFTVRVVDSHRAEGERDLELPLTVLSGSWRRPVVRWHGSVRGTDDVAARVARSFTEAAGRAVQDVRLEAGDLLAFSNERCLHGRDRFAARLDGRDRWLLRSYAVRDVARTVGVVSPARPGVLRLDLAAVPDREDAR